MTHPDHERDESELKALFDATAETPDGAQLTKLKARAVDVPARGRRPRWMLWAPLAMAAGVLAVLVVRGGPEKLEMARGSATAPATLSAPEPSVAVQAPEPGPSADPRLGDEVDENGAVADLGYADEGLGVDALFGPADDMDDEELDGWLAATGSFLEDG